MSYSFAVRASNRTAAIIGATEKFDEVVKAQACHASDRMRVLAAVQAFVGMLADDPAKDIAVSVSGTIGGSWANDGTCEAVTSVGCSVSAMLVARPASAI